MDKRTIIAFVLIGLILFFYGDFVKWLYPPPPVPEGQSKYGVVGDSTRSPDSALSRTLPVRQADPQLLSVESDANAILDSMEAYIAQTAPIPSRLIIVETERYHAVLTTDGAQFKSLKLKPYKRYMPESVELIPDAPGARPAFRFWTKDGQIETTNLHFTIEGDASEGEYSLNVRGSQKESLSLTAPLANGRALRVTYTFTGDDFQMLCTAEGVGTADIWVRDYAEVIWQGGLSYTESDSSQDHAFSMAYTLFAGDVLEEQKMEKKNVTTNPAEGKVRWTALRTKYFIVAMLPESAEALGSWMESRTDSSYFGKFPPNRLGVGMRLPIVNGSISTPVRIFAGPIDDELLTEIDPTLKRTMNFGWAIIAPFSKATLWGLKAMYKLIPNYGICIIIFSILIKLIIWPLTQKQYSSMAAMQRVQPQLTVIREKYKNDPARLNKEMMKLYKEEKINPMGGCLPMLLQIPLLWALFTVFRSTIEFRLAPFALWINDLSLPDYVFTLPFAIPIYGSHFAILPILMAVTTFYQTKMTMTDPNQKPMLYMMPVMMLLFFNSFPSGLNLYYTLLNVWTFVQQKITPIPRANTQPS